MKVLTLTLFVLSMDAITKYVPVIFMKLNVAYVLSFVVSVLEFIRNAWLR